MNPFISFSQHTFKTTSHREKVLLISHSARVFIVIWWGCKVDMTHQPQITIGRSFFPCNLQPFYSSGWHCQQVDEQMMISAKLIHSDQIHSTALQFSDTLHYTLINKIKQNVSKTSYKYHMLATIFHAQTHIEWPTKREFCVAFC